MKTGVREALHIENEALAEKYLGLPMCIGRSSKEAFEYMPTRIRDLVGGWSGREASGGGREVLIKSVAQAVLTYPMSCFLIPKDTCKKMKSIIANYWWGGATNSRQIHWQSWEQVTRPKMQGDMGFRNMHLFNLAMLGKQGWRIMTKPDSLCARVLRGRYFHGLDFLSATRKRHERQTWRAILARLEVLKKGLTRRIGNGATTRISEQKWIPYHFKGRPLTPPDGLRVELVVDLMTASGGWNEQLIREIFIGMDAEVIFENTNDGG
ncbi:hypothetical protein PR202_gb22936 [Eleusine coracana subsp. coracana]|uniref:Uncharacterized protein n=1 Tax=Eleusine coracana subsp. coracana TaxID=191504 RepID=A0AAV5FI50_ELECO|nr:hypothetical protein PR202_gb22936 [Eleusine coracana subsp. coracana]